MTSQELLEIQSSLTPADIYIAEQMKDFTKLVQQQNEANQNIFSLLNQRLDIQSEMIGNLMKITDMQQILIQELTKR